MSCRQWSHVLVILESNLRAAVLEENTALGADSKGRMPAFGPGKMILRVKLR